MGISRRTILKLAGLSPFAKISGVSLAQAEDRQFRHALTLVRRHQISGRISRILTM